MGTQERPDFDPNKSSEDLISAAGRWAYKFMGAEPPRPRRQHNPLAELFNKEGWAYYLKEETSWKDVGVSIGLAGIVAGAVAARVTGTWPY